MDTCIFCLLSDSDLRLPVYLTTAGQWGHQEPIQRPEGFASYQWLLTLSGEGMLYVDGQAFPVKAGQAIALFPHVPHRYHATKGPWEVTFIAWEGSQAGPLLDQAGIHQTGVYQIIDMANMMAVLSSILKAANTEGAFSGVECSKLVYSFLLDLPKHVNTSRHSLHQNVRRLQPVISYIKRHCHEPLSIELLAEQAGVSPQYLCQLFKKGLNLRPMEYVNRERINRSKQLIYLEPDLKIQEIAHRSGFEHSSYFCTVFKRLEGITPEQFRRSHGPFLRSSMTVSDH
ncbi:AraC family transcriptional regulator [Paenibacillus sp. M1]|uniref:AraC family transcriptional regulator n=1 Tax=Paenibacillus haidiansis TaxID=1574488 RepID=A0ABU7VQ40_9BACL